MTDVAGQWAMITGAAGGLGTAMAADLAKRGAKLILTDLDDQALAALALTLNTETRCFVQDVTDAERWEEIACTLEEEGQLPRVLINNAGIAALGYAMEMPMRAWKQVIDVDLWGTIHGCRTFVPRMQKLEGRCAVMNVASASAYLGLPLSAPYFVAKSGVMRLTQSLSVEIPRDDVSFTVLCPGPVGTGIGPQSAALGEGPKDVLEQTVKMLAPKGRTPDQVATKAIRGMVRGRAVVNVFWEATALDLASRLLPHQWVATVSRAYFRRQIAGLIAA